MTFVDDTTGTLGTDAIGRINAATSSLDVKVAVASTNSRAELDGMVGRLVNSANTVAVGVDPIHHYTFSNANAQARETVVVHERRRVDTPAPSSSSSSSWDSGSSSGGSGGGGFDSGSSGGGFDGGSGGGDF